MTTEVGKLELPSIPLIEEGSWGQRSIGTHSSTMTLFADEGSYFIEWDIPTLETTTNIGLTFEHKALSDYDGVCSLPKEAITLIEQCGFTVSDEFRN